MSKPLGVRTVDEEIADLEPFANEPVRLVYDIIQEID